MLQDQAEECRLQTGLRRRGAKRHLECDFLGFSYGFRPKRHQHQALDALYMGIYTQKVIWAVSRPDMERLQLTAPHRLRDVRGIRDDHQAWGGYPPVWQRQGAAERLGWLKDYRKPYLERDIADVGQVANIDTFALAQKLLCARTANLLSISEVAREVGVAANTVK